MSFKVPSDSEEIRDLNEKIEELTDNQIFSRGSGDTALSSGTFGRRNNADGRSEGLRGNTPRIHQLTENDAAGTPTGTFDRINLITTLAVVDHASTPMSLKHVNGKPVPGTMLRVTPKAGKTLDIKVGGDFAITSDISLAENEYADFVFFSEAETGITGGGFKPSKTGTNGGSGGLTEPVILTINDIVPQDLPATSIIDWSLNPNHIVLDRDVEFEFASLPPDGKYQGVLVVIDTDATGGFAEPVWPASLVSVPIIDTTPLTRTSIMLYTIDGGATVTYATSIGTSSSGVVEFLGPWTAIHDAGNFSLTNLAALQIVDTGGTSRGTISGDSAEDAVRLSLASGEKFIMSDVLTDIVQFDNVTGLKMLGNHVINMNKNTINQIKSLELDESITFTPTSVNVIGFDNVQDAIKYNVALTSDAHRFQAAGELLANITRIGSNQGALDIYAVAATGTVSAEEHFFLFGFTNSSPSDGDIWRDDTSGLIQFRQNSVTVGLSGSPLTAKGDLYAFGVADARLPVGTDTQILAADSAESEGLKWIDVIPPNSIIDGTTSLTADGGFEYLIGIFDGDADQELIFGKGYALHGSSNNNYFVEYQRDDLSSGQAGDFIAIIAHRGFNDAASPDSLNYYQAFSEIASPTDGSESGLWTEGIASKGAEKTAYTLEGGAGLINTNILHSFFGSVIVQSDQNGEESILDLIRNDNSPNDNNTAGVIRFRAENSIGEDVTYGSVRVEMTDVTDGSENARFSVDLINGLLTERMITADSLLNEVILSPTVDYDFIAETGSFILRNNTDPSIDDDFISLEFQAGATPITYAAITSQIKKNTNSGRVILQVRAKDTSVHDALVIEGDDDNAESYLTINSRIHSDLKFGEENSDPIKIKISPTVGGTQLGIVVQDNVSYTVGDDGMNTIPITNIAPGTALAADALWGNHKGALGVLDGGGASPMSSLLFLRLDSGHWIAIDDFILVYSP